MQGAETFIRWAEFSWQREPKRAKQGGRHDIYTALRVRNSLQCRRVSFSRRRRAHLACGVFCSGRAGMRHPWPS